MLEIIYIHGEKTIIFTSMNFHKFFPTNSSIILIICIVIDTGILLAAFVEFISSSHTLSLDRNEIHILDLSLHPTGIHRVFLELPWFFSVRWGSLSVSKTLFRKMYMSVTSTLQWWQCLSGGHSAVQGCHQSASRSTNISG